MKPTSTTPVTSILASLMVPEDPGVAPVLTNVQPIPGTTAMWATAVWGSKPAAKRHPGLELPAFWDSTELWAWSAPGCGASPPTLHAATNLHSA